mgnify:CR=1 FL=1
MQNMTYTYKTVKANLRNVYTAKLAMEHLLGKFIRIFILHPIECQKKLFAKILIQLKEFLIPFRYSPWITWVCSRWYSCWGLWGFWGCWGCRSYGWGHQWTIRSNRLRTHWKCWTGFMRTLISGEAADKVTGRSFMYYVITCRGRRGPEKGNVCILSEL